MSPPSKSRIRAQQDRQSSQELLEIYGSLLTPKQYAMTAGYCVEGKSFSQIAREQGVSRQAVHEAVRGVQRLLRYYEEKLQLKEFPRELDGAKPSSSAAAGASAAPLRDAITRLEGLRSKVTRKGIIYTPDWIVQEIEEVVGLLEGLASVPSGEKSAGKKGGKK